MLGAIVGDVVGSVREGAPPASRNFPLLIARSCSTRAIRERVLVRLGAPLAEAGQAFVQRYAVPLPD